MFNSVDFPEPLTPLIVTKSPLLTVNAWIEKWVYPVFFWILDRETISFLFITFPFKDLIRLSFSTLNKVILTIMTLSTMARKILITNSLLTSDKSIAIDKPIINSTINNKKTDA